MKNDQVKSRRNFLKSSIVGTTGLVVSGITKPDVIASPLTQKKQIDINPQIDNLRVVCCHDPKMSTKVPNRWNTIADQNEYIDGDRVQANLDAMAKTLAKKETAQEAWATIFMKPAAKEWSHVRVAIKANCKTNNRRHSNNPRLAVLDKVCKELNRLGVPFNNIIIYDGDDEEAEKPYKSYVGNGLPAGVIVSKRNNALGGTTQAPIPAPWNKSDKCTKDIANGNIDILVNITVNKGSHSWTGRVTLCLKNHYGTFGIGSPAHDFKYLVGISKSNAIIGGTPPRQQLCIVDSIFASISGPAAVPNKAPYKLVMGTYGPVVDYLTIKKIRETDMGATHNASIVKKYLTEFGYTENDVRDFIYVDPSHNQGIPQHLQKAKQATLAVTLGLPYGNLPVSFSLRELSRPVFMTISNLKGQEIQSLSVSFTGSGKAQAFWNGRDFSGRTVGSGIYLIMVRQNGKTVSKYFRLHK